MTTTDELTAKVEALTTAFVELAKMVARSQTQAGNWTPNQLEVAINAACNTSSPQTRAAAKTIAQRLTT